MISVVKGVGIWKLLRHIVSAPWPRNMQTPKENRTPWRWTQLSATEIWQLILAAGLQCHKCARLQKFFHWCPAYSRQLWPWPDIFTQKVLKVGQSLRRFPTASNYKVKTQACHQLWQQKQNTDVRTDVRECEEIICDRRLQPSWQHAVQVQGTICHQLWEP